MLSALPPKVNGTKVRPVSMAMIADMIGPSAAPPYSSGVLMPQNPDFLALARRSRSTSGASPGRPSRSLRSTSGSSGMTSFSMKDLTVSRICRSSGVSEKSTAASWGNF